MSQTVELKSMLKQCASIPVVGWGGAGLCMCGGGVGVRGSNNTHFYSKIISGFGITVFGI